MKRVKKKQTHNWFLVNFGRLVNEKKGRIYMSKFNDLQLNRFYKSVLYLVGYYYDDVTNFKADRMI